jgi:hypothetical protein
MLRAQRVAAFGNRLGARLNVGPAPLPKLIGLLPINLEGGARLRHAHQAPPGFVRRRRALPRRPPRGQSREFVSGRIAPVDIAAARHRGELARFDIGNGPGFVRLAVHL